jgi:hypothetical protein
LTIIHIKEKINFFIFYFVLSTITKYDIEIIILSCTTLPNIILSSSFFSSYLFYFHCLCLFYPRTVIKRYLIASTFMYLINWFFRYFFSASMCLVIPSRKKRKRQWEHMKHVSLYFLFWNYCKIVTKTHLFYIFPL